MNAPAIWKLVPTLLVCAAVGAAYAKLPPLTEEQKAKAAEAKVKSDEAAKKEAEALTKVQDRVAERYKKEKGAKPAGLAPVVKK